jgi:NADH:ubiquinone oxidoreductase subunit E
MTVTASAWEATARYTPSSLTGKGGRTVENRQASIPVDTGGKEFTQDELAMVDGIIDRYREKSGALIPVLEEVQEAIGYLPKSIQRRVALGLGITPGEVHGVVTFYSFFTMAPRGRHTARCCLGTACYVRGGRHNLEKLTETLAVEPGDTTEDRRFSLETVRCLGACGLAPVVMVDEDTYRQVKPSKISEILDSYE